MMTKRPGIRLKILIGFAACVGAIVSLTVGMLAVQHGADIGSQLRNEAVSGMVLVSAGSLAALMILTIVGLRLARSVENRLSILQSGVEQVAQGNYSLAIPATEADEIGQVTRAFNVMTQALRKNRDDLLDKAAREASAARLIERLAYTDPLTGLQNRSRFSTTLAQSLQAARGENEKVALFFVDLDRFKVINDTLGHDCGDDLIAEAARRISGCMESPDAVARLGGDEFVVIVPGAESVDALRQVAGQILQAVSRPMSLAGQPVRVSASIGISIFPIDGSDERSLMKAADVALYRAKDDGRNAYAFYCADMDSNSIERLAFESSLRNALEKNELRVYYQPKVDGRTGKAVGVEALLRWAHPTLGMVSPAQFIPIAEETGLIIPIGRWVLRTACEQQRRWRSEGIDCSVAVNLSPRQFSDSQLVSDVRSIVDETRIDPQMLELEITESMLMNDVDQSLSMLKAFKGMGIRLSVDDFGTGYSSLANLKLFPVDTIKIDRSFVRSLPENADDKAIAEAIIAMCKSLGKEIVAEGVETAEQASFLTGRGCDLLQGYYFGKPEPEDSVTRTLEQLSDHVSA